MNTPPGNRSPTSAIRRTIHAFDPEWEPEEGIEDDPYETGVEFVARQSRRLDLPAFRAGDTVKVHLLVVEGNRQRVQIFQGVVIRIHGSGIGRTFTVRKVSFGVGVERTIPLHAPIYERIEVVARGDVRRAKLYYLRNLRGKAAKIKERRIT